MEVSVMEYRLMVLLMPQRLGLSITEVCRREGISRPTFYDWRRRWEAGGLAALAVRSRRPWTSPNATDGDMVDEIRRMHAEHRDWGPDRIQGELVLAGNTPPHPSTIYRILIREGDLEIQPRTQSRLPTTRFERSKPNELWQTDATSYLVAGQPVEIMTALDDKARRIMSILAVAGATGENAIDVFRRGIARCGPPAYVLSDNGTCFTGRLKGAVVDFERFLWNLGIVTINSSPSHPQTQGKIERFHRTVKTWLDDNGPFDNIAELQAALDAFESYYNGERPHQGIGNNTPDQRWAASTPAGPVPGRHPSRTTTRLVNRDGKINYSGWLVGVGQHRSGQDVDIIDTGDKITVLAKDGELLNRFASDDPRKYIGTGRPPGRRPATTD